MVKVCDAIMGSGKTSAAISYINAHPEKKFLYITPYLPEAARIKQQCPDARFVEPSDKLPAYGFSKSQHSIALIEEGRNIASTHKALVYYTPETIRKLKDNNYTLIIDEEITVLQQDKTLQDDDIQLLLKVGYIEETMAGEYVITEKSQSYTDGKFSHVLRLMQSRPLIRMSRGKEAELFYWAFPPLMFQELDDVILMTYLFAGSEMEAFFNMNGITYTSIGVEKKGDIRYEFSDTPAYAPTYVSSLDELITVETNDKMNSIGNHRTAMSMNWYKTASKDNIERLRKNILNYFVHRAPNSCSDTRLCGTYKKYWGELRAKGYWNEGLAFSQKSSNEYRHKCVLAYPVNVFRPREITKYYSVHGQNLNDDQYALSTMVQWIWRSAIREGKAISIYIPSKRMRKLLTDWIKKTQEGGCHVE